MQLTPDQMDKLRAVIDTVLTDAMYTLLLASDGEASMGEVQQTYELKSEDGTVLTGQLETETWKQFHASQQFLPPDRLWRPLKSGVERRLSIFDTILYIFQFPLSLSDSQNRATVGESEIAQPIKQKPLFSGIKKPFSPINTCASSY